MPSRRLSRTHARRAPRGSTYAKLGPELRKAVDESLARMGGDCNVARDVAKAIDAGIEWHIDEIKDAIDRLHEIPEGKQRTNAARQLIDYITLHHNLPCYG